MEQLIKSFKKAIQDFITSIDFCNSQGLMMPTLVQIYSFIDAFAWLSRPDVKDDSDRNDFMNWVDKFILIDSTLNCNSLDLYAARCSIIHSMTPRAKLVRDGKARIINYCWGSAKIDAIEKIILEKEMSGEIDRGTHVALHIDDLISHVIAGIKRYETFVFTEKKLAVMVLTRANSYFKIVNVD